MRRAFQMAGRSPQDVSFLELHATGTARGDPTEANWAGKAFQRDGDILIGSVKGNIGYVAARLTIQFFKFPDQAEQPLRDHSVLCFAQQSPFHHGQRAGTAEREPQIEEPRYQVGRVPLEGGGAHNPTA
jgi:hypothetical protein